MEPISLDEIDLQLLQHLQTDASITNQDLAQRVHVSPPTCLRRIKRLTQAGLIERQIAVLNIDKLAPLLGYGLTAISEVSLDRQGEGELERFEQAAVRDPQVQQCYRTSPGPDFVLIAHVSDMPTWLTLTQRLFTAQTNVRNVKTFFSVKRAKFEPHIQMRSR